MNQNNRKPPADRRPQGSANILHTNDAGKRKPVPNRGKAYPEYSEKFQGSANNQRMKPNSSIKKNASVHNRKNSKSGKSSRAVNAKTQPQNIRKKLPVKTEKIKKQKLTAEEIARQTQKREAYIRRQIIYKKKLHDYRYRLFKERLRIFLYRFVLFAVMFVFCFIISIVFFFINLLNNGSPETGVYICQTGGIYDVTEVKTVKGSLIFRNGSYYINITDIASYCEFTTTGDINHIRFISKNESNDNVRFKIGDSAVYVNKVRVRLTAPVIADADSVYIPVEFFDKYALGISVEVNEQERKLTISRSFDEATSAVISNFETENLLKQAKGEKQTDIRDFSVNIGYGDISFTLHQTEPTEHIDEYTIGRDLLLITDPEYIAGLKKLAEQSEKQNTQTETIPE